MAYTNDPRQPKVRRDAALFAKKHGVRCAARRYGVSPGTISKWRAKAKIIGLHPIPTKSSRPKRSPNKISDDIRKRIIQIRLETKRTSEVVHKILANEGVVVSLNSVRRTIDRHGLMKKRSPWKRYHPPVKRPVASRPGSLVQIDTIHRMIDEKKRLYVFVLIDVCTRWVYAKSYASMNAARTIEFLAEAQEQAVFDFKMIQTDHGPEFGKWFVTQCGYEHRYTRVGKPNDNAHVERVNRTLQEECLDHHPNDVRKINIALKQYVQYYNHERLHMGIELRSPMEFIRECSKVLVRRRQFALSHCKIKLHLSVTKNRNKCHFCHLLKKH